MALAQSTDADSSAESKDKEEKLSLLQWGIAFERYALAAACIPIDGDQGPPIWDFQSAMAHRKVVYEAGYL